MSDRWPRYFFIASVLHGLAIALWSFLFILDGVGITLNLSRIIAGGGVGTWFTLGYLLYLVTGFVGMAIQGTIYYIAPRLSGKELYSEKLATAHFVLMNIAIVCVTWMLGIAGYQGGTLTLADRVNEIHPRIVVYVQPIGYCIIIGTLAALLGGINILMTLKSNSIEQHLS
ncbi:MAG: cbb3-type cytochrome c oxidase subunit I [Candidatus Bathyarchaeia archaeon]